MIPTVSNKISRKVNYKTLGNLSPTIAGGMSSSDDREAFKETCHAWIPGVPGMPFVPGLPGRPLGPDIPGKRG